MILLLNRWRDAGMISQDRRFAHPCCWHIPWESIHTSRTGSSQRMFHPLLTHKPPHDPPQGEGFGTTLSTEVKDSFKSPSGIKAFQKNPDLRGFPGWLRVISHHHSTFRAGSCFSGNVPRDSSQSQTQMGSVPMECANTVSNLQPGMFSHS